MASLIDTLADRVKMSYQAMSDARKARITYYGEYLGRNVADGDFNSNPTSINHYALFTSAYLRYLITKSPSVNIQSQSDSLQWAADDFELAVNRVIKDLDIFSTLESWVIEALYSLGVIKCGLDDDDNIYVSNVYFDD